MARTHILIVEDEASIRGPLAQYLEKQGFRVAQAGDASIGRSMLLSYQIDLVLLDIMMPGEDGLSLCLYIAANHGPPVILLTAKGEEMDKVVGLEIGADDYVTKPFSPRELTARMRTVLRRHQKAAPITESGMSSYSFSGWTLNVEEQSLFDPQGTRIKLSTGEYRLLETLVQRPNQLLNRDQLLDLTQGREGGPFDRAIDNSISRLRKKLEKDPKNPEIIKTVWGGGYRFCTSVTKL